MIDRAARHCRRPRIGWSGGSARECRPRRWFAGLPVVVLLAGLAGGCGDRSSSRPENPPPPAATTAAAENTVAAAAGRAGSPPRPSSIPLDQIGLVHRDLPMEPEKHTWDTEHLNDAAGGQLKALAKWLSHPDPGDETTLAALAAADCRATRLRPEKLAVVYADGPLTVQRMEGTVSEEGAGLAFLSDALLDVVRPAGAESIAVQFKIFRVTATGADPETLVRVEVVRQGGGAASQQVAQWQCTWRIEGKDQPPKLARVALVAHEETTLSSATPAFAEATDSLLGHEPAWRDHLSLGLDHWLERIEQRQAFGPSGWEGLAMGDADGDGRQDLYVSQPGGLPNRLLLQQPDGTLRDVSAAAGVDWWDQTQSALFVDFDNDGDQDLAIAVIWGVIFMANDGRGVFEVRATQLTPEGMPYALAAADVDADGDTDLYVGCYARRATAVDQRFLARPVPYHDAANGSRNILYRNDQGWRFTDVTKAAGLEQNNRRFTFAAAWEDADGDGDPDLYVANDFGRNNFYRLEAPSEQARRTQPLPLPTFRDVAAEAGVEDISAGMSATWGDADNDGRPDIYVSNMWSSAGNRIAYQRRFREGAEEASLAQFQRHSRGNSLFHNAGDGTFNDVSEPAGVTMGRWAWGSRFADLNNDGWEDLVVANGYITQPDAGDL
jgi:hypothetical protein